MKKRLFIYHYNPIELFPPVVNFLNFAEVALTPEWQVKVFTTYPPDSVGRYHSNSRRIQIIRIGKGFSKGKKWRNLVSLLWFNLAGTFHLSRSWIGALLYFETSSALPAIIGKLLLKKGFDLYIHYHEYMSPQDYARTRFQSYIRSKELLLYKRAKWVSHTNQKRMEMFLNDINLPFLKNSEIMPNYPPADWNNQNTPSIRSVEVIRFVFVGSVTEQGSYIREFLTWLGGLKRDYTFDIFTQSETESLRRIIRECNVKGVRIRGYVNNSNLPDVLSSYHVGLILYKGIELNVIYSAPNKLFEYLACGLDVWVDTAIRGVEPYYTERVFPKVVPVSFSNLLQYDVEQLINREGLSYLPFSESYEKEYKRLLDRISNKSGN